MKENNMDKLKTPLKGWQLLLAADLAYLFYLLIGGVGGAVFGLAGLLFLLLAIVTGFKNVIKKKRERNSAPLDTVMTIIGTIILLIILSAIGSQN